MSDNPSDKSDEKVIIVEDQGNQHEAGDETLDPSVTELGSDEDILQAESGSINTNASEDQGSADSNMGDSQESVLNIPQGTFEPSLTLSSVGKDEEISYQAAEKQAAKGDVDDDSGEEDRAKELNEDEIIKALDEIDELIRELESAISPADIERILSRIMGIVQGMGLINSGALMRAIEAAKQNEERLMTALANNLVNENYAEAAEAHRIKLMEAKELFELIFKIDTVISKIDSRSKTFEDADKINDKPPTKKSIDAFRALFPQCEEKAIIADRQDAQKFVDDIDKRIMVIESRRELSQDGKLSKDDEDNLKILQDTRAKFIAKVNDDIHKRIAHKVVTERCGINENSSIEEINDKMPNYTEQRDREEQAQKEEHALNKNNNDEQLVSLESIRAIYSPNNHVALGTTLNEGRIARINQGIELIEQSESSKTNNRTNVESIMELQSIKEAANSVIKSSTEQKEKNGSNVPNEESGIKTTVSEPTLKPSKEPATKEETVSEKLARIKAAAKNKKASQEKDDKGEQSVPNPPGGITTSIEGRIAKIDQQIDQLKSSQTNNRVNVESPIVAQSNKEAAIGAINQKENNGNYVPNEKMGTKTTVNEPTLKPNKEPATKEETVSEKLARIKEAAKNKKASQAKGDKGEQSVPNPPGGIAASDLQKAEQHARDMKINGVGSIEDNRIEPTVTAGIKNAVDEKEVESKEAKVSDKWADRTKPDPNKPRGPSM